MSRASKAGSDPPGRRLRDYALAELARASAQLALDGEDRHAGIHQARKSMRRARATLALARRALGDEGRRLDADLASLCRGLGSLRDAQALIEALQRLEPVPASLAARIPEAVFAAGARRDATLSRALAADPEFSRRRARLVAMAVRLAKLDWEALRAKDVRAGFARSERRLAKARRRLDRHPEDDERWHVVRRRLRRLRQQDSLLVAAAPELRPAGGVDAGEATLLGHAQDDVLLLRHCGRRSPFPLPLRRALCGLARERLARVRGQLPTDAAAG